MNNDKELSFMLSGYKYKLKSIKVNLISKYIKMVRLFILIK